MYIFKILNWHQTGESKLKTDSFIRQVR